MMPARPDDRPAGDPTTRHAKITRDRVLAAALELVDRDGIEGLIHAPPRGCPWP